MNVNAYGSPKGFLIRRLNLLERPSSSLFSYCILAASLALGLSVTVGGLAFGFFVLFDLEIVSLHLADQAMTIGGIAGAVIFDPLIETAVLVVAASVLTKLGARFFYASSGIAFTFAYIHSLFGVLWFFGVVCSFFVYTCGYLAWKSNSFWKGFTAAAIPHATVNAIAIAMVSLLGKF